nr:hypothetical protein [Clostridia bacterium]
QGQHRTAILSLKMSELKVVYDEIGEYPILLLDDFMSELDEKRRINFLKKLKNSRKIDIIKGFTTKGIHRDDFNIYINDNLVNVYGSQGQHRTAILSLKMSELKVIYDEIGENPILLLDDFMSELDEKRRKNFLDNIKDTQVLITCTDKFVLEKNNFNLYNVKSGKIAL